MTSDDASHAESISCCPKLSLMAAAGECVKNLSMKLSKQKRQGVLVLLQFLRTLEVLFGKPLKLQIETFFALMLNSVMLLTM